MRPLYCTRTVIETGGKRMIAKFATAVAKLDANHDHPHCR